MRHITGIPRQQLVLFPESLDEYISAHKTVADFRKDNWQPAIPNRQARSTT